jgi:hypothetical protein
LQPVMGSRVCVCVCVCVCTLQQDRGINAEIRLTLGEVVDGLSLFQLEGKVKSSWGQLPSCRNSTCHFAAPSLAGSSYRVGIGNRCWSGWQQSNPPTSSPG